MLILLFFLKVAEAACPQTLPTDASFAMANQYHAGESGSASSTHLLSYSNPAPSTYSTAYYLASGSFMKTPTNQCPQTCLSRLRAMGKAARDGTISSIIMMSDAGESPPVTNILYSAYKTTVVAGEYLYCSSIKDNCGASVPLYLYYNTATDDYQVRGEKDTVDDDKAVLWNQGMPICYLFPALTTTSTSTSTNGTHIRRARDTNESNNETRNLNVKPTFSYPSLKNHQKNANSSDFDRNSTEPQLKHNFKFPSSLFNANSTENPVKGLEDRNNSTDRPAIPTKAHNLNNISDRPDKPTVTWPNRFLNNNNSDLPARPTKTHNLHLDNGTDRPAKPTWPNRFLDNNTDGSRATHKAFFYGNNTDRPPRPTVTRTHQTAGTDQYTRPTVTPHVPRFSRNTTDRFPTVPSNVTRHGKGERERTSGAVSMVTGRTPSPHPHDKGNRDDIANGTAVMTKGGSAGNNKFLKAFEAAKLAASGGKMIPGAIKKKIEEMKSANETMDNFLSNLSPEDIEKKLGEVGIKLPGNVSLAGVLQQLKQSEGGNVTFEEAMKSGLSKLGIDLPANFSAMDGLPLLLGEDKEKKVEGSLTPLDVANGTAVTAQTGGWGENKFLAAIESAKSAALGGKMIPDAIKKNLDEMKNALPPANETMDKFLNKLSTETIEKKIGEAGIKLPGKVSIAGVLQQFKQSEGINVTLEEAVKSGLITKTLAHLGFELPANFSAADDLLPLLDIGKEKHLEGSHLDLKNSSKVSVSDILALMEKDRDTSNSSIAELLGKGKEMNVETALSNLGIHLPGNVSASDLLETLGIDKNKDLAETLSSLGIKGDLNNILGKGGLDTKSDSGEFLHVLTLTLDSLDDQNKTKSMKPVVHPTRPSFDGNQTKPENPNVHSTRPTQIFDRNQTHPLAQHTRSMQNNGTAFTTRTDQGKTSVTVNLRVEVETSQNPIDIRKKMEQKHQFMETVGNQTVAAVEKILERFNTSLAEIHPKYAEVNGSTPVLLAEIALPVKLNEKELDLLREETSDVKNLRVFDDHLTVGGGADDVMEAVPDHGTRSGTRTPQERSTNPKFRSTRISFPPSVSTSTRTETKTSAQPPNQSKQTNSNAKQTVTNSKGSSTTTSSGSSTSSASTTTTANPSSSSTVAAALGSSTTTVASSTATGPSSSTATSVASGGLSTTTTAYTGPPTTSTTADPTASTTTSLPPSSVTSSATGSVSTTTTPKPTTTTSPYAYNATTDISGTYGPGDQKLENGTVIRPNGDTIYPNGTVKTSDGSVIEDGKKIDPDGTVHNPDGSTKLPNGTMIYPDNSSAGAGSAGKSGDDAPTWVIPVVIVTVLLIGIGALGMIVFGVTSMMKGTPTTATINPYDVPKGNEQWPNQRQPKPSADLPPPVADPVTTAQPQSFGATQTLHGAAAPNSLYFG